MKAKRTVELTVERNSFVVTRRTQPAVFAWCGGCGAQMQMVRPEEASRYAGGNTRLVYRRIEAGDIHFIETASGHLLVCLNSLDRLESSIPKVP